MDRLIERESLPADYRAIITRLIEPLAERIARQRERRGTGLLIGINGSQGSGKTTLCTFLEHLLVSVHSLATATLSLDDLYLGRAHRQRLAREVHPLLATRGVPGTHDVALGKNRLSRLLSGKGAVSLPRFDKATDDPLPEPLWPVTEIPVDVVLFEGWCVGAEPEPEEALAEPCNRLELEEDPDGRWRRYVNAMLAGPYRALFGPIDLLVMLRPPSFDKVLDWRRLQEEKLRRRTGQGMTDEEVTRFVMHYERLTRHMMTTMPAAADVLVQLDGEHGIDGIHWR